METMSSSRTTKSVTIIYATVGLGLAVLLGVVHVLGIAPLTRAIQSSTEDHYEEALRFSAWGIDNIMDKHLSLARQIASRSAIRQRQLEYLMGDISLEALRTFSIPKLTDAIAEGNGAPATPGQPQGHGVLGIARYAPNGDFLYGVGRGRRDMEADPRLCAAQDKDVALLNVVREDSDWTFLYCSIIHNKGFGRVGFDIVAISGDDLKSFIVEYSGEAVVFALVSDQQKRIFFEASLGNRADAMDALRAHLEGTLAPGGRFAVHQHRTSIDGLALHAIVDRKEVLAPLRAQERTLLLALPVALIVAILLVWAGLRPMLHRFEHSSRLAQSRADYHDLFHGSKAMMFLVDPASGAILEANEAAVAFYGYSRDRLLAMNTADINTMTQDELAATRRNVKYHLENVFEFQHRLASGDVRDVEVHSSPISWEGRDALFSIIHDITDRKRLQAHLVEARQDAENANKAKSEFVASMSHELRTPLNAVLGFSEIIRDDILGPASLDRYRDYAHDIHDSGVFLIKLIDDLLDLSKIEAGRFDLDPERIDVAEVAESCLRLVRHRATNSGLTLETSLPDAPLHLLADARALRQILFNLLSNAIKYTAPGGKVTLSAQRRPDGAVELAVTDTGIGLTEADQKAIFAPFVRSEQARSLRIEGTGLGLVLVKTLAQTMGATVTLKSRPGEGSTFAIVFPASSSFRSNPPLGSG